MTARARTAVPTTPDVVAAPTWASHFIPLDPSKTLTAAQVEAVRQALGEAQIRRFVRGLHTLMEGDK